MFLLIARSLLVYGAAAAFCLWAAQRWVVPIRRRVAILIALAPLLFTGKATLTGGVYAPLDILYLGEPLMSVRGAVGMNDVRSPLLSDVIASMIPWQKAVRQALKNGRAPLWNPFVLAGEPLLAVQQSGAFHPTTWVGFLLPLPQAWTLEMSLRLLIAILSAYLFFRELGCGDAAALGGAIGWGFSDFLVFWLGYPVSLAIGPFPLLLLGLERLVRRPGGRSTGLTTAALVLIVTAGHPETLLFAVAGGGVYFLFALAGAGRGRRLAPIGLSLAAGALALGLTAVQLLPLAEIIPQTWEHALRSEFFSHLPKSVDVPESLRRSAWNLVPYTQGPPGAALPTGHFGVSGAYAGVLLVPLAICGIGFRHPRRWALLTLGLLGAGLWARAPLLTDTVASLPLFNISLTDYFVFLALFGTCGLAALGLDRLARGEGRRTFVVSATSVGLVVLLLFITALPRMRSLSLSEGFLAGRLALEIVPLVLAAIAVSRLRRGVAPRLVAGALVLLLTAERIGEAGEIYRTCPASAFYPPLPVLDAVPRGVPGRFVAYEFLLVPNQAAMYELEDVRGYESLTLRAFAQTFPLFCAKEQIWFNLVPDLKRPFLSFLNVRWALTPPGWAPPSGWTLRAKGVGADLIENTRSLPRAFLPRLLRVEPDPMRRLALLASIDDFGERGVLEEDAAPARDRWVENPSGRVTIRSYRGGSGLSLDVEVRDRAVVATSVPAWPGWKARLDGQALAPLRYNHAFLGFAVPAGRHRLVVDYEPDGWIRGRTVSLATAALAILIAIVLARRRRRRACYRPAPP